MRSPEALLQGFEPDFEFEPVDPLPADEFLDRMRRLRRDAVAGEYDAVIIHADMVGWYHTSNPYLRYMCDWIREGVLIIPSDEDLDPVLLSVFTDDVLLPPPGEPIGVDDIRQVAPWGRHFFDQPGSSVAKLAEATRDALKELSLLGGTIAVIGDELCSPPFWLALSREVPTARYVDEARIIIGMQRVRSELEQGLIRGAAQLIDIGLQAAYHVTRPGVTDHEIYSAFTFAQMARGGETGDGYQIGVNRYGTHISKPYGHIVRAGDLICLYASTVSYRGYSAQAARMIGIGDLTPQQEEVLEMCVDGVQRAMAIVRPGVLVRDLNQAAFTAFIERGYLESSEARTMPWNWSANADGTPRAVPLQNVADEDWERQGRALRHVYPATKGPNSPGLGHALTPYGVPPYPVSSHNYDRLEPGMVFVLHAQWLDPMKAGCNTGNTMLVTRDGAENLNCHTPLEPFRVTA